MHRTALRHAFSFVLTFAVAACSSSSTATGGSASGSDGGGGPPGGSVQGSVPAALVGSWYAGAGGTTAPYEPQTGQWGTPTGKGLVYVFEANATYTKAFQSDVSSGGCTTGFTAFESGSMSAQGDGLTLTPNQGNKKYSDSCAPSLSSDDPLTELSTETFTWKVEPSEDGQGKQLVLTAEDSASSTFQVPKEPHLTHGHPLVRISRFMAVKKVSISVDETLLEEARKAAGARGLSGFVNDALRVRLQHERLRRLLDEMDAEHGPVPAEEIARARKLWPGKKKKSRRAA